MDLQAFFQKHPVFNHAEFVASHFAEGPRSRKTRESLLAQHVKGGRLLRVRRGLYAVVPAGVRAESFRPDPYLVAAKMTDDAVLAYHTALEFRGRSYSVYPEFQYLTARATRPVTFRSCRFRPVRFPKALRDAGRELFAVDSLDRAALEVRVTALERTLVDVLDRPDLGGAWEEVSRSLESVESLCIDRVVEYALLLGNSTTIAKLGLFLEQHQESLSVPDDCLVALAQHRPRQPHYVQRGRKGDVRLVRRWNLVVPVELLEHRREKVRLRRPEHRTGSRPQPEWERHGQSEVASDSVRALLRELKDGLALIYGDRLKGVYASGSYARGEPDVESDLDVIVVLDAIEHYAAEVDRTGELISRLSLSHGVSISRVFVAEDEWASAEGAFLVNAREEAVPA